MLLLLPYRRFLVRICRRQIFSNLQNDIYIFFLFPLNWRFRKNDFIHLNAPRVPVKSTVGAGDSMLAGIVYALSRQESLKEVLAWGVACGTATTMNEGTGLFFLPQVEQVKKLIH